MLPVISNTSALQENLVLNFEIAQDKPYKIDFVFLKLMEDPFETQYLQLSILLHYGASAILHSLGQNDKAQ